MPHITLEHSSNTIDKFDTKILFAKCHAVLVETNSFKLSDIKSRLICHKDYLIGDGDSSNAFAHISVAILAGRDLTVRRQLSEGLMNLLKETFIISCKELKCSLTVEVREMDRETYAK